MTDRHGWSGSCRALASGFLFACVIALFPLFPAHAQQTTTDNLSTCLAGRYPALCRHDLLTPEQQTRVHAAELRENASVCLTGRYPALCNHSVLLPAEAASVREAERSQNLGVCVTGRYPALCDHQLLSADERTRVTAAEVAQNLQTCVTGRYPAVCDHQLLSGDERTRVRAAEVEQNRQTCLIGRFAAICDHSLLTADQLTRVRLSEQSAAQQVPNAAPTPASTPTSGGACYESSIVSPNPFMGNHGEIFKLLDGTFWKVVYEYEYLYEYNPDVVLCPAKGKLLVAGKSLAIEPIATQRGATSGGSAAATSADVIESKIDGEFSGWEGETIFKLMNGQIWQQSTYAYTYRYAYSPKVLIYRSGSGYKMKVDGVTGDVTVRRIK